MRSGFRQFGGLALFAVFAIAAVVLGLTKAKDDNGATIVRYKETLRLERDGKAFSASGVMQSRLVIIGGGLGPVYNGQGISVQNSLSEAIAVEVAPNDYVFALPTYPTMAKLSGCPCSTRPATCLKATGGQIWPH